MAYISDPYDPPQVQVVPKPAPLVKMRFTSVDALKGLSVIGIWVVFATLANPAAPSFLKPGGWGHTTLADCLFPALLVGIGAGIPLSAEFRTGAEALGRYMLGSASKAFWLIVFGVVMESVVAGQPVFNLGALQLLGVAYMINAVFARTPIVLRVFLAEGLLLALYGWTKLSHVPGALPGTFNENVNIIRHMNEQVFAPNGLRGLLALIPITSIVMSGSVLGSLYLLDDSRFRRGLIFMGIGGTLTFFGYLWSLEMAMTSALWTSSYALFTTGITVIVLGIFNIFFDFEKGRGLGYAFTVPGYSIILAIVGPVVLKVMVLNVWRWPGSEDTIEGAFKNWIATTFSAPIVEWAYAIAVVVFWWVVLAITYHRREWLRKKCEAAEYGS